MDTSRRDFVKLSAAGLALAAVGTLSACQVNKAKTAEVTKPQLPPPKKILILGGTEFLGPALINAAKARGHSVTLFNRGRRAKRKVGRFEGEDTIIGNRDPEKFATNKFENGKEVEDTDSPKGLTALAEAIRGGRTFDAVIDTSGYVPRIVRASAELLAPVCKHYVFISTVSVYARNDIPDADESAGLATMPDPTDENVGQYYGALKALCEKAAEKAMPGKMTSIRPGYIVGPDDPSDRFTYWPWRASQGGDMLAPGNPNDPIQVIDVRDLARLAISCIENGTMGIMNAVGPKTPAKWGDILDTCVKISPKPPTLTWVDADFLEANPGAGPGQSPIWLPPAGEFRGFHSVSNAKAVAAGLAFMPMEQTLRDILEWFPKELARRAKVTEEIKDEYTKAGVKVPPQADPKKLRAGIAPEAEAKILEAWKARKPTDAKPAEPASEPGKK